MKFAHYLEGLVRDCPELWAPHFLKYKMLKKLLKACHPDVTECPSAAEARFFEELEQELRAANRYFAVNANKIIDAYQNQMEAVVCCWARPRRANPRKSMELAQRAYWCRKYAKANAVALRKILKKHDKLCNNSQGKQFLQECWRSDPKGGVGLFLHSPLLDELKAIQDVLQAQMPPEDPDLVERPQQRDSKAGSGKQEQGEEGGDQLQEQQQCAQGEDEEGALKPPAPVKTGGLSAALARFTLARTSVASTGAQSASALSAADSSSYAAGGGDCGVSYTAPSLRHQRQRALSAIVESPTCMLDTADIEWCGSAGSPPALHVSYHSQAAHSPPGSSDSGPELTASQLAAAAAQCGGAACGGQCSAGRGSGAAGAAGAVGRSVGCMFTEEELKCPICLDVMYKPVGLGCGHKFCRRCALEAAGFGRAIGALQNICSHIPLRAPCPQCRQQGVYRSAVPLREVGKVIQARFPEEWAERRAEEKERDKRLALDLDRQHRAALFSRSAFELLFMA